MAVYLRVRVTRVAVRQPSLVRVLERVLAAVGEARSDVSVELVGDSRMRRLNREYRKQDRPTDVLAFPMRESDNPCPTLLGDVVISVPTALRQASKDGRSLDDELATLLIHGVLHLCGYDHERNEKEARLMRRRERAILNTIGSVPRLVASRPEQRKRSR